jgi:type I restriction-modification system DNA methylase subunit
MKVLADRDIEEDFIQTIVDKLQSIKTKEDGIVYDECRDIFEQLDKTYNGSIFLRRTELDSVKVSNKILLEILKDFLPQNSRYNFKVIPIEILGTIYEQFLGKVVITTEKQAKIDYKPEVRKAGGVYYTPDYIVDYIVENTLGEKLKNCKSPEDLLQIKICDPACGSGSFLLSAYDTLIRWTISYYEKKVIKEGTIKDSKPIFKGLSKDESKLVYLDDDGQVRLTSKLKREILRSCIYGVDIDAQAVEVTKMSLSLKTLENTNHYEVHNERTLFHTTILPSLEGNIKCGNSLVGMDIYDEKNLFETPQKEKLLLNAFDWDLEFFSQSKKDKGFDCIIGNPPYIRIQTMKEISPISVSYFGKKYETGKSGNYDIYLLFVELALKKILNSTGLFGYILPSKFFTTDYGEILRSMIISGNHLSQIIDFKEEQVFNGPTTYTCLLFLSMIKTSNFSYIKCTSPKSLKSENLTKTKLDYKDLNTRTWIFSSSNETGIFKKLLADTVELLDLPSSISRGSSTGSDEIFIIKSKGNKFITKMGEEIMLEDELLKIPLYATDFNRYSFNPSSDERIIFPYILHNDKFELILEKDFKRFYPNIFNYLLRNKKKLEKRKQYTNWYSFSAPRSLHLHIKAHIVIPLLANHGVFSLLPEKIRQDYCLMASGGFSITIQNDNYSPYYILGLINSKLLFWNLNKISNIFRGGWITCTKQYFGKLPIKLIDVNNKSNYDEIILSVKRVLELKSLNKDISLSNISRELDYLNKKIDSLVYQLYDLTEEEIEIVEGGR